MGWLDLIDLGIGAANLYQVSKTRQQLTQMQNVSSNEALRRQLEDFLRNYVFNSLQNIKSLQTHIDAAPLPVFVIASVFNQRFLNIGITPEIFSNFNDKEYVLGVQNSISDIIRCTQEKLAPEQVEQGRECVDAIMEMPQLNQAVHVRNLQEQLASTQAEWNTLSKNKSNKTLLGVGSLALGLVVCPCAATIVFPMIGLAGSRGSSLAGSVFAILVILACIAAIGFGIRFLIQSSSKRFSELKSLRDSLLHEMPPGETVGSISRNYPTQSSLDLENRLSAHNNLISMVMGQIDGYQKLLGTGEV